MTWQRIDDDTYIDDTLVTCAEYQLFIDEMREQGKYFQPDHWISFQFSKGQAHEPILGVRYSDAVAFCEWLVKREGNAWNFRLGKHEDVNIFPIKSKEANQIGYWEQDFFQFTWARLVLSDVRSIRNILSAKIIEEVNLSRNRVNEPIVVPTTSSLLNRKIVISNTNTKIQPVSIDRNWEDLFKRRLFAERRKQVRARSSVIDRPLSIEYTFDITSDLSDQENASKIGNELIKISDRSITNKNHLQKVKETAWLYSQELKSEKDRDLLLEIFIDLLTLQERIAGRSPAFEGIRLVKERIK